MIVILGSKVTKDQMSKASEEFGSYIKIVVDLKRKVGAIGGKFHADAEKVLLQQGSNQDDLWGGGMDLSTKKIDMQAVINIRPKVGNESMEILDPEIRKQFSEIVVNLLI